MTKFFVNEVKIWRNDLTKLYNSYLCFANIYTVYSFIYYGFCCPDFCVMLCQVLFSLYTYYPRPTERWMCWQIDKTDSHFQAILGKLGGIENFLWSLIITLFFGGIFEDFIWRIWWHLYFFLLYDICNLNLSCQKRLRSF